MHIFEDIQAYKKNDPAARSVAEILLLYNGLHATIDYRIAHWLHIHGLRFLARSISQWSKLWTGIEIHPGAKIGRRLVIDHGTGIVVGETLLHEIDDKLIRDELAGIHVGLGLETELRLHLDCSAEKVAGRDVSKPKLLNQLLRLRALACARGTEQNDVHVHPPSKKGAGPTTGTQRYRLPT